MMGVESGRSLAMQSHDTDAFGTQGGQPISPERLAMVIVVQSAENLADRQSVHSPTRAIGRQRCPGSALTEFGFDFSVLSQSRTRSIDHDLQQMAIEIVLDWLIELGLVKV